MHQTPDEKKKKYSLKCMLCRTYENPLLVAILWKIGKLIIFSNSLPFFISSIPILKEAWWSLQCLNKIGKNSSRIDHFLLADTCIHLSLMCSDYCPLADTCIYLSLMCSDVLSFFDTSLPLYVSGCLPMYCEV